jgi:hypothetical protein
MRELIQQRNYRETFHVLPYSKWFALIRFHNKFAVT